MAGFDRQVYEKTCLAPGHNGHNIQTHTVGYGFDPVSKQMIAQGESLCIQCGMSLEEIREQNKKRRVSRKAAEQEAVA